MIKGEIHAEGIRVIKAYTSNDTASKHMKKN